MKQNVSFRTEVKTSDINAVENIVRSTGFFREDEIEVAVELIRERIGNGEISGYEFVFAEIDGVAVSYTCYGLIPCSLLSYDLYWIVTHNDYRGKGIGKMLMTKTESLIAAKKGKAVYVETSSKELYKPTCAFYESSKYVLKARFEDFYDYGDDKLVFVKLLR